jgi:AAA family ATP:ADP antiporter
MSANLHPTPLDRLLRLFTDVRAGESGTALLLTFNIFLIFVAYSIMKVLREGLVLVAGGVDAKAASAAAQAIVLLAVVPLYGALASRVPRRRLINIVTSIFIACLGVFYALRLLQISVGIVFYIWLGIFSVMVVAQFWGFANDVYTTDEGKRLFPIVMFGSSSGAVIGAWLPRFIQDWIGVSQLLLLAAALLMLSIAISNLIDARERRRTETHLPDVLTTGTMPAATGQFRAATGEFRVPQEKYRQESGTYRAVAEPPEEEAVDEPPQSTGGAFQLVFRSRYLLLMAMLVLLLNWVNTGGENILAAFVRDTADRAVASGEAAGRTAEEIYNRFYSGYQGTVNAIGMLLQLFVVSRIIKYLNMPKAILILPLVAFVGYSVILFVPLLGAVRWAKTAENSTDYSLNNTVRQALFLPTTREEKYKAKQVVDSFSQRAGDVLAAVTWFGGTMALGLSYTELAAVNLVLIAVWLAIAVLIGRRYRRLEAVTG